MIFAQHALVILLSFVIVSVARANTKPSIEVKQITPADSEILEEWIRVTNEHEILGVTASKGRDGDWQWQVFIAVAEFVRQEPLESKLVRRITAALQKVPGAKAVAHEDREVWLIQGEVSGEQLVRSVSETLDTLAPELRKHIESL